MKIFIYTISVLLVVLAVLFLTETIAPSGFISFLLALELAAVYFKYGNDYESKNEQKINR